MFQIGDKVKCIGFQGRGVTGQFTVGKIYEVRSVREHSIEVMVDDSGSLTNGWSKEFFELVGREPEAVVPMVTVEMYVVFYRMNNWANLNILHQSFDKQENMDSLLHLLQARPESYTIMATKKLKVKVPAHA